MCLRDAEPYASVPPTHDCSNQKNTADQQKTAGNHCKLVPCYRQSLIPAGDDRQQRDKDVETDDDPDILERFIAREAKDNVYNRIMQLEKMHFGNICTN